MDSDIGQASTGNDLRLKGLDWSLVESRVDDRGQKNSVGLYFVRGWVKNGVITVKSVSTQGVLRSTRNDGLPITFDGRIRTSLTFSQNWVSTCSADLGSFEPVGPSPVLDNVRLADPLARARRLVSGKFELITVLTKADPLVARWLSDTKGTYCLAITPRRRTQKELSSLRLPVDAKVVEWVDGALTYVVIQGSFLDAKTVKRLRTKFGSELVLDLQVRTAD